MSILDSSPVAKWLKDLRQRERAAFAALCAERLFPAYRRYCRMTNICELDWVETALSEIWRQIDTKIVNKEFVYKAVEQALENIPRENGGCASEIEAIAEDAISSLCYALQGMISDGSEEAFWAARRVIDAIDTLTSANERRNGAIFTGDIGYSEKLKAEEERQLSDISDILGQRELAGDFSEIRARARAQGELLFDDDPGS